MPTSFPEPRRIATNGIAASVHVAGEGPAVLLLHGFPELAYSWRKQVGPLAAAGYRVIVPDQRGYGGSDAPAERAAYSTKTLVDDLVGILDALEIERAVFVGHDGGSLPAWYSGFYAPERVVAIASLCTPYMPPGGDVDRLELLKQRRGPNTYVATFQEPGVAEALLERDVEATFRALMRGRGYTMEQFLAAPPEVQELPAGVFVGDPQLFGDELLSEEELAVYVDTYRRTGFRGPLGGYRAIQASWEEARGRDDFVVDKPALMISAADDWFFPKGSTDHMDALLPRLERHVIPAAGHWVQQEQPEAVNRLLLDWLARVC